MRTPKRQRKPLNIKRTVITLCGSTRFEAEYIAANRELTLAGFVVFSCGVFGHSDDSIQISEAEKCQLDAVHICKINMSDAILVLDPGGYIGSSTMNEITYATKQNKAVFRLSEGDMEKLLAGNYLLPKITREGGEA